MLGRPRRTLSNLLVEELTCPYLPISLLLWLCFSRWDKLGGSVFIRMMGTPRSNSGGVGFFSLVLQPADSAQAGKQLVITWLRMTEGWMLLILPTPICCLSPNSRCCQEQSPGSGGECRSQLSSRRAVWLGLRSLYPSLCVTVSLVSRAEFS